MPALILDAIRKRSFLRLDAAIEQLIPPLSVPVVASLLCAVGAVALGAYFAAALALVALAGQVGYLLAGLWLVHAPARAYLALSTAPRRGAATTRQMPFPPTGSKRWLCGSPSTSSGMSAAQAVTTSLSSASS